MSRVSAVLEYRQHAGIVRAHVMEVTDDPSGRSLFYFCCETCGNCGKMWFGEDYARVQAAHHVTMYDHTRYIEGDLSPNARLNSD